METLLLPANRQLLWSVANASSPWAIVAILAAGIALLVAAVIICCGLCAQMHKGSTVAPVDEDSTDQPTCNHNEAAAVAGAAINPPAALLPTAMPLSQPVLNSSPASTTSSTADQVNHPARTQVTAEAAKQTSAAHRSTAPSETSSRAIEGSGQQEQQAVQRQHLQHHDISATATQGKQDALQHLVVQGPAPPAVSVMEAAGLQQPQQQQQQQQQQPPILQQVNQQLPAGLARQQEQGQQQQQQQQQLQQQPLLQQQPTTHQVGGHAAAVPPLPLGPIPLSALTPAAAAAAARLRATRLPPLLDAAASGPPVIAAAAATGHAPVGAPVAAATAAEAATF